MTACPLCKGPLERLGISLKRDFVMCINEDCVYPFQDEQVLLSSVIDLRAPGHRSLDRKRKPETLTSSKSSSAESTQQSAAKKLRDADSSAKLISTATTTYTNASAANASSSTLTSTASGAPLFYSASKSSGVDKLSGSGNTNIHAATKTVHIPAPRKETSKSAPPSAEAPTKETATPVGRSSATTAVPTLPSIPASTLTSAIPVPTSTIALPATASTSAIPATAAISRAVSSIPDEIPVSLSSSTSSRAASPTAISSNSNLSQPGSPTDLPDLTFDLFPNESWITPVTPPDTYSPWADGTSKAINPAAVATPSTTSIESLLFDDSFDIDIPGITGLETNGSSTMLQFDADFEALLQQQF
ncbi:hypothetical protein EDD21DRAFT_62054 [Dissophora ornata]|nr:hypothetical protein BGZ58_001751 [Dissophora ornata]KAI8602806.1 hypothetical protein EDD21DRAFT_62054 [Dissophora ornata]